MTEDNLLNLQITKFSIKDERYREAMWELAKKAYQQPIEGITVRPMHEISDPLGPGHVVISLWFRAPE